MTPDLIVITDVLVGYGRRNTISRSEISRALSKAYDPIHLVCERAVRAMAARRKDSYIHNMQCIVRE